MTAINAFKPLTKDDIADVLGVSLRTIENWVNDRTLPAPRKLGNRVYWHPNIFYGWLEQCLSKDAACEFPVFSSVEQTNEKAQSAKPRTTRSKVPKTALERMRSREQAKLDAMLS